MTLPSLRSLAGHMSNCCFVRHWGHYNYPQESPWQMALCLLETDGRPAENVREEDLPAGWAKQTDEQGRVFYIWERTDENGEPFNLSNHLSR